MCLFAQMAVDQEVAADLLVHRQLVLVPGVSRTEVPQLEDQLPVVEAGWEVDSLVVEHSCILPRSTVHCHDESWECFGDIVGSLEGRMGLTEEDPAVVVLVFADRRVVVVSEAECAKPEARPEAELATGVMLAATDPTWHNLLARLPTQRTALAMDGTEADRLFSEEALSVGLARVLVVIGYALDEVCDSAVGTRGNRGRSGSSHSGLGSRRGPDCSRTGSLGGSCGRDRSRNRRSSRGSWNHSSRTGRGHILQHNVGDSWPLLVE